MDTNNKTIIAQALGVDESARCIRYILNCLKTIEAGQIQNAELTEDEGNRTLDITAENNTNYRIYLSQSNGVQAVNNLDTGEWPVMMHK